MIIVYALGCLVFNFERLLQARADPREPPLIPHRGIPFIGHIIGMFWHGAKYFQLLCSEKTNYPIYTLQTLTARTVIVKSPTLAGIVQRSSRSLSFYSMILEVTKRIIAFDEPTMRIVRDNANRENGDYGLMPETHDLLSNVLGPGAILNSMSSIQLESFANMLNNQGFLGDGVCTSLMGFVKNIFTTSNALAIYGPENPFAMHPSLINDFWNYESGMIALLADIFPAITARKPYLARERILKGLQEFVEREHYKKASLLIQQRVSINLKHGLTTKMAGNAELIMLFGILGNAVPTTFWLLANIFSRPALLTELRQEAEKAVTRKDGQKEAVIHVNVLKTSCPVLVSTYRETLRAIANLASVRFVLEDTLIADKYLLKKNSIVQIASGVIHVDESVWGPDAASFNPRRFISTSSTNSEQFSTGTAAVAVGEQTATQLPKNVPSAAYRAFGGGSVICPGRHFAQSEIVGFAALVLLAFDVTAEDGGVIQLPERDDRRIPLSVMKPMKDVRVRIRKRETFEKVRWGLEL
ncbi:cytochrome P450 [Glonium stellatum]|uniref:Cytochrome P450 n=1 Tax=Glonium stellatum TaxID=574774 RepID=A0A8E2FA43_9PEZI|nr:cytochrome P450 [Glonium stellatum]